MKFKTASTLATALLITACASPYEPPTDTTLSIPVTVVNRGPGTIVHVQPSPDICSTMGEAGSLGVVGRLKMNLGNETLEKKTRILHSQPITITMGWWDVAPIRECGEKVTFTPSKSNEYQVEFISTSTTALGLSNIAACTVLVSERPLGSSEEYKLTNSNVSRTRENLCIR